MKEFKNLGALRLKNLSPTADLVCWFT
jgi:hypothetical protein